MTPDERDAFLARLEAALDARVAELVEARLRDVRPAGRWNRRRMAAAVTAAAAAASILVLSAARSGSGPDPEWRRTDGARLPRPVVVGRSLPPPAPVPPEPPVPPEAPSKPVPPVKPAPPQHP